MKYFQRSVSMMLQKDSLKKTTVFVMLSILALYLFLAPVNQPLYDLIMFPCPDPRMPDIVGALEQLRKSNVAVEEVSFRSSNDRVLQGIFFELPGTKRVFLLNHTKGNNMYFQIPKARLLLSCGASIFMYDYQGFGKSQDKPTVEGVCDDAVAAYDYLANTENRTGKDIIAMGQSFGSGVNQAIELFNRAIEPKQILILPQGHCSFGRGNEFAKVVREFLRRHDL